MKPALQYVGFRGDEYWSAIKFGGKPRFIHRGWDSRAVQDAHPDDTVIYAKGTEADPMRASPITISTNDRHRRGYFACLRSIDRLS